MDGWKIRRTDQVLRAARQLLVDTEVDVAECIDESELQSHMPELEDRRLNLRQ